MMPWIEAVMWHFQQLQLELVPARFDHSSHSQVATAPYQAAMWRHTDLQCHVVEFDHLTMREALLLSVCPWCLQAVAVQGVNKGYQLKAADLTVGQLSELSVYNVRRLFANRGSEFMSRQLQHVGSGSGPVRKARIANAVFDRP